MLSKIDGDVLSTLIFLVITAIFGVIGYLKKKAADEKEKSVDTDEDSDDEIFIRYLAGEEEMGRQRQETLEQPIVTDRVFTGRKKTRRPITVPGPEPKRVPAATGSATIDPEFMPIESKLLLSAPAARKIGRESNLLEALPKRLTPNQKAIVLTEILGPPKGLKDF
ncbi:MAG: hypothetical protein ACYS8W_18590 [Planctomycetota bacterium]